MARLSWGTWRWWQATRPELELPMREREAMRGPSIFFVRTADTPTSTGFDEEDQKMTTVERFDKLILERPDSSAGVGPSDNRDKAIALRPRAAGSSFFWAMQLLPYQRRKAMYALYSFCREVDDIADGDAPRSLKDVLLSDWRSEIALLYAGSPQHEVTRALKEAVHLYGLECNDFLAIIDGMAMDVRTDIRAPTLVELDLYCERVAVAVGRLSVRIFGEESPAGERVAAELGRALQLTNILRDLAEDGRRHRLYLPREVLQTHGIFATTASWVLAQPALADVCRDVARLAEGHFAAAAEAIAACPRHKMRPAIVILAIYRELLRKLLARGWRHLEEPVRIPAWRKLALVLRHGLAGVESRDPPAPAVETKMLPWPEYSHFAASLLTLRRRNCARPAHPAGGVSRRPTGSAIGSEKVTDKK